MDDLVQGILEEFAERQSCFMESLLYQSYKGFRVYARTGGAKGGRALDITDELKEIIKRLDKEGHSNRDIEAKVGISRERIRKIVKGIYRPVLPNDPQKMATCHPDKPHRAKGYCSNCYHKLVYLPKKHANKKSR